MKHFKLLLILFIGLSIVSSSCKKTEEEQTENLLNELLDVKGSIDLSVNGNSYDQLFSSVVFSESDQMVSFWAYEYGTEESFIVTFGEVPAVGSTATIDFEADDSLVFIIMGSFLEGAGYYGESGTVERISTDKYNLNVVIKDNDQAGNAITITGTVTVGEHNP